MATIEHGAATGVSFALTDEQKALRDLARDFAAKEIRPNEAECDEKMRHPVEVIAKAHELGLMNLHVPEEYGGLGLGCFDGMLVGEELYWGCAGIGTSVSANGLGAGPVIIAGSDEQKAKWLAPLIDEPILCSFGLSEPGAGSDVASLKSTAVRDGDEYVINGSKTFITNAGYAAWTVVFAKTDPKGGSKGMSAFIVPMDTPGVTIEKHRHLGVRAPGRARPGREPARRRWRRLQDRDGDARLYAAGHRCRCSRRRASGLRARGRVCKGARHLRRADRDAPGHQLHDRRHGDGDRGVAAPLLAGRVDARPGLRPQGDALLVIREALLVQVLGGYGYIKEYPVEKLMRDAKLFQIYEGTSQIQRLVIAKEIFLPRGD
jgi:acyl-CoA dehydrogenase